MLSCLNSRMKKTITIYLFPFTKFTDKEYYYMVQLFITLPKKRRPTKSNKFRLLNRALILLRILQNRIFLLNKSRIDDEQSRFINDLQRGTILLQKGCDCQKNLYICFIEFEKVSIEYNIIDFSSAYKQQDWTTTKQPL